MAVYTEVSDGDLRAFIADYDLGCVLSCKGIAEGVENTNYLLVTEKGPFILTLYEKRVKEEDLPFFLSLMEHLASRGVQCPLPVRARNGQALQFLSGRHAVIVTFLSGMWPRRVTPSHCLALGEGLAKLHLAGADFPITRQNDLSLAGWPRLLERCFARADEVSPGLAQLLDEELKFLESAWPAELPIGTIHADLFPDNVFFMADRLTGFIDFYFACTDYFAYDVAICLNAWCFESDGAFNITKARALLSGYQRMRPLSRRELVTLPILARGSALRFLLTRLHDWLHHPPGAFVKPKDPREYLRKLRFHQSVTAPGAYGLDVQDEAAANDI